MLKKVLNKISSACLKLILFLIIISSSYFSISQAEITPTEEEVRDAVVQQMMYIEGQRRGTKKKTAELVVEEKGTSEKKRGSEKEEAGGQEVKQSIVKKRDAELKQKIPKKITTIIEEDKAPKMTPLIVSDKREEVADKPESNKPNEVPSNVTPLVDDVDKKERVKVVTKSIDKVIPIPATKTVAAKETLKESVEIDFDKMANFIEGLAVEKEVTTAKVAVDQEQTASSLSVNEEKLEGRNKALIGWVYLGRFDLGEWENGTLEINKALPEVGNRYFIKASTLNLRSELPKKGKLGKVTHALKQREQVKILQLKGSGRNHNYWAEIIRE